MKSYRLEISKRAADVLSDTARRQPGLFRRLSNALDDLEEDPFAGKPLKGGLKGLCSLRVGTYRIVYRIYNDRLLVIVINIAHRRDVYR